MTELQRIDMPLSPFDETRLQLIAWQKQYPEAAHVLMVLDTAGEITTFYSGGMRPTDVAGLFFAAAHMEVE